MRIFMLIIGMLAVAILIAVSVSVVEEIGDVRLDLFGRTERARIEADAAVRIAEVERDATIGAAQAEASKAHAWAMAAPVLAGVIMAGLVILAIVWWQGKIYYRKAELSMLHPGDPGFVPALRRVARRYNAQIEATGSGRYYLVADDASYEVKALPAPKGN